MTPIIITSVMIGGVAGLLIGAPIGFVIGALMRAAKRADAEDYRGEHAEGVGI